MELPFAVESSSSADRNTGGLGSSQTSNASSLVTASSQDTFLQSSSSYEPILATPVSPHAQPPTHVTSLPVHGNQQQLQQHHLQHIQQQQRPPPPQAPFDQYRKVSSTSRISSVLSQFGAAVSSVSKSRQPAAATSITSSTTAEDNTYADEAFVDVYASDADDVDILLAGADPGISNPAFLPEQASTVTAHRGDILTVLLSGPIHIADDNKDNETGSLVTQCEEANNAAARATQAKKDGHLQEALDAHTAAAKLFREAAVHIGEGSASMAKSLLLLSQTQAKSALALKRVLKLRPNTLSQIKNKTAAGNARSTHKERLRATVRGALDNRTEADISDSAFLGRATGGPTSSTTTSTTTGATTTVVESRDTAASTTQSNDNSHNPVDEMIELERELRDMDSALALGSSIASLDARTQNRMKNSMVDGSFMVVPPGSSSYMSSSSMWTGGQQHNNAPAASPPRIAAGNQAVSGTAGARARANRVQNILEASNTTRGVVTTTTPPHSIIPTPTQQANAPLRSNGLESSWWGNSSSASQVLTSSVISLASGVGGCGGLASGNHHDGGMSNQQPANTKQLMRLMDSLKTLGDENAALLREVDGAEAARMEAKATREQMKKFKLEYAQRFEALKAALDKFKKNHPGSGNQEINPVTTSDFMRATSASEQLQRQEQLIRKLTADLKKEKEESKKKDAALRKYESFYKEVKARSAQKAAQRKKETQQRPPNRAQAVPRVSR